MYTKLILDTILAGLTMEVENCVKMINGEIYICLEDKQIKLSAKILNR